MASKPVICPACRGEALKREDGTIVPHTVTIKAAFGRKARKEICRGSTVKNP